MGETRIPRTAGWTNELGTKGQEEVVEHTQDGSASPER